MFVWFLWLFLWLLLDDTFSFSHFVLYSRRSIFLFQLSLIQFVFRLTLWFSFSLCCALKKTCLCATLKGTARIPIPLRSCQLTRAAEDLKMFLLKILFVWFLWLLLNDVFSFSHFVLYSRRNIFLFQLSLIQFVFRWTVWLQKTQRLIVF